MYFNALPTLSFTPSPGSFPFEAKHLSLPEKVRIPFESESNAAPSSSSNGIFPRGSISLSAPHAEIWIQGKQVLIRDRASAYGTYVNGIRIQQQTLLQDGDIVTFGRQLSASFAPQGIRDYQLRPVEGSVSIVGV